MKNFLKYLIRWIIRIVVLVIILAAGLLYVLSSPSFYFDYHKQYRNLHIYSDSTLDNKTERLIDNVIDRVAELEIYNPNYAPDIYLISDRDTYEIIAFLSNQNKHTQSFNLTALKNIFINLKQVENVSLTHSPEFVHTILEGKLDQVIAHEFVRGFICDRIGWFSVFNEPEWKIEGYCEYGSTISSIRNDKKSNLIKRANALYTYDVSKENTSSVFFYRAQLMIEYLSEIHKMDFDQILKLPTTYEFLSNEFDEWYLITSAKKK